MRAYAIGEMIRRREAFSIFSQEAKSLISEQIIMCSQDSYLAGHNSRDAEVAELKAKIKKLTEWQDIANCPKDTDILVRGGKWYGEINYIHEYKIAHVRKKEGKYEVQNLDEYEALIITRTHFRKI